jgi:thiol-disulfide isomerase/thioredoxin
MKNIIIRSLATVAALAMLASCTGRVVDLNSTGVAAHALILKADTYAITADGSDYVQFTVTLDGRDITSDVAIQNIATEEILPESASFTSTTEGEVTFATEYTIENDLGQEETLTSNSQTIKVVADSEAKIFYRNCGIFRFSGTWCAPCYELGQTFNKAIEQFPDRTVLIMSHVLGVGQHQDPYTNPSSDAAFDELIDGKFMGIPVVFFDFRDNTANSKVAESELEGYITNSIEGYPANSGIQATSTVEGTTATIDVEVTATQEREYFLTVALIEDGIVGGQTNATSVWLKDYTHNNVLRSFGETSVYGKSLGTIAADGTATMQLTYDLTGYEAANCRFAIFVNYKDGDSYFVDNAAYCPVAGSIRYSYDA